MYTHDQELRSARRRAVAVVLLVIGALVVPSWLWFVRGRRLPLRVVVQADRYLAPAGATISLDAKISPPTDVTVRWTGQGLDSHRLRPRWVLPRVPGVYTARITVRRSGSVARDAISVVATPGDAAAYPTDLQPPHPRLDLTSVATCKTGMEPSPITVEGRACANANLVVALEAPIAARRARSRAGRTEHVWFWWQGQAQDAQPGPLANLRVPDAAADAGAAPPPEELTLVAAVASTDDRCAHLWRRTVLREPCRSGPQAEAPFADFGWRLIGRGTFRFAAKPLRGPASNMRPVHFSWDFGDGQRAEVTRTTVVHDYRDGRPQHVVQLTLAVGALTFHTRKVVTDRGASQPDHN